LIPIKESWYECLGERSNALDAFAAEGLPIAKRCVHSSSLELIELPIYALEQLAHALFITWSVLTGRHG
jgi:hypothetical protein